MTLNMQEKLKELYREGKNITIYGMNDLGQAFETNGRISKDSFGKIGIDEQGFYVEFGSRQKVGSPKFQAYFTTDVNLDHVPMGSKLIVDAVYVGEDLIFENEKYKDLLPQLRDRHIEFEEKLISTGKDLKEDDRVTKELRKRIAGPIILDGKESVLCAICGRSALGRTNTIVMRGKNIYSCQIDYYAHLETEDLFGKKTFIAENQKSDRDLMKGRI